MVTFIISCSDHKVTLQDGQSADLSDWSGNWLLINYWAIWCKPCIKEIPELNALDEQSDIAVLGVNFEEKQGEALAAEIEQLNIKFPNIIDGHQGLYDQARPTVLPATMLIDPKGVFKEWLLGPQTTESIRARLESHSS